MSKPSIKGILEKLDKLIKSKAIFSEPYLGKISRILKNQISVMDIY